MRIKSIENSKLYNWWKPKAGFLLALLFFSAALARVSLRSFSVIFLLATVTLSAIGVWGHLLNDWGDRAIDAIAGKKNLFHNKSFSLFLVLVFLVLLVSLLPWFFLPTTVFSYLLLFIEFLLFVLYAIPPIRLKEKIYLAVVTDALYAYAIPAVLAFHTYTLAFHLRNSNLTLSFLFFWSFFIGLRHILYHHVADELNDKKSGINNIALTCTKHQINRFIKRLNLPIELFCAFAFFYVQYSNQAEILLTASAVILFLHSGVVQSIASLSYFPNHTLQGAFLDRFYQSSWLFISLVALILINPAYLIFLPFIIVVFSLFFTEEIQSSLIFCIKYAYKKYFFNPLSTLVNYSIYYFRKYFLSWSEEKNRGVYYDEWKEKKMKEKNGRIAIFNQNLNKYTETFVQAHIRELPFKIDFYYGKDLLNHQKEGHLLSNHLFIKSMKELFIALFAISKDNILIENLQKKGVQLILSEFGPTASQVAPIAQATGIPHICIFHGYDAWNKKTLKENDYTLLFQSAKAIVGVSQDICSQLKQTGCPKEKIHYLPCGYNTDLFTYSNHKSNAPIFLSVGRFAETKSPHLTILAFKEVLKEIPNAQLRMIGKDGGGELFEACHILVKALGIEDKVKFLGILPPEEVAVEMRKARVFVQHSLTTPLMGDKEGTPVSIMEAMASGLPIVATKHAGIAEIIEDGTSGVLVDEYDYIAMAKAMVKVCESDELVKLLGKGASNSILNNELIHENSRFLTELIEENR